MDRADAQAIGDDVMIEFYTFDTGNCMRAAIGLEEAGLPYRTHKVDLAKGEQKSSEFLKINMIGAVPAIADDDGPGGKRIVLAQSGAILLYVAEKSGRLMPKDPERRAAALQWLLHAASDVAASSGMLFQLANRAPEKSQANLDWMQQQFLLRHLSACDQRLKGRDYLADELSIADLALFPIVSVRREMIEKAGGYADLLRWAAAMAARPAVQRGMKAAAG
jgi:GSH-dependent disulfide-bond oxidoreductase